MKAPTTDKTLGIAKNDWGGNTKFADVRQRAMDEYRIRNKRIRKNHALKAPEYKPGDLVVCAGDGLKRSRYYVLIEVIDFEEKFNGNFKYFGIIRKSTDPEYCDRIGRLMDTGPYWHPTPAYKYVEAEDKIKWRE